MATDYVFESAKKYLTNKYAGEVSDESLEKELKSHQLYEYSPNPDDYTEIAKSLGLVERNPPQTIAPYSRSSMPGPRLNLSYVALVYWQAPGSALLDGESVDYVVNLSNLIGKYAFGFRVLAVAHHNPEVALQHINHETVKGHFVKLVLEAPDGDADEGDYLTSLRGAVQEVAHEKLFLRRSYPQEIPQNEEV